MPRKRVKVISFTLEADGEVSKSEGFEIESEEDYKNRILEERLKKEIGKLSAIETDIYNRLENMIDDLYIAGVDVSYFPISAKRVLAKEAKKICQLLYNY